MRILSFNERWQKLSNPEFTTFRYPRSDEDWYVGEKVQVFYKSRSPHREKLGIAEIINKERRELDPFFTNGKVVKPIDVPLLTEEEANIDGFHSRRAMTDYMERQYGLDYTSLFNKLTLLWIDKLV